MKTQKKRIGVYPGSFDPLTNGHLDIIIRASKLFDLLIVGVLKNDSKKALFSMDERVEHIRKCTKGMQNVKVEMFEGLLVDFVKEKGADTIVRGLRAVSDYEYELQMAMLNKHMSQETDTIFFMTDIHNSFLSSSVIKDIAQHGGNIHGLVPEEIVDDIYAKMKEIKAAKN
ncbi:MAG: pantetheine-phosphate adenylyltransferase [Clostridia bacterium]|nr:pantetheine-phosphate adenylyltransferase [Clostridia bacterium]